MPTVPISCDVCSRSFLTPEALNQHSRATGHDILVNRTSEVVYLRCTLCSTYCAGLRTYRSHVSGARHQKALRANANIDPGPEELEAPPNHISFDLCQIFMAKQSWRSHINGKRHKIKEKCVPLKNRLEETEPDKNGITIAEDTISFGILSPNVSDNLQKIVRVTNSVYKSVKLMTARLSSTYTGSRSVQASSCPSSININSYF